MHAMLLRVWLRPVSRQERVDAFEGSNGDQSGTVDVPGTRATALPRSPRHEVIAVSARGL
jgi:hypothetical protein